MQKAFGFVAALAVICVVLFMTSQEGALVAEEHVLSESAPTVDFKEKEKKLLHDALKVQTMPDGPKKVQLKMGIIKAAKTLKEAEQAAKQSQGKIAAAPVKVQTAAHTQDVEVEHKSGAHVKSATGTKVTTDPSHELPSSDFKAREKLLMANALKIRTMANGAQKTKFKQEIVASAKALKSEEEAAKHAKQTENTGMPHFHMDKFGHMVADPAPAEPVKMAKAKGSLAQTDMQSYADMICLCVKPQGQPCDWPLIDKKCQSAIVMQEPTPDKCKMLTDKQNCRLVNTPPPHVHLMLNTIDTEVQTGFTTADLPYGNMPQGAAAAQLMRNMAKVHAHAPLPGIVRGPTVLQAMQTKLQMKQQAQAANKQMVKELEAKDKASRIREVEAAEARKKKDAAFWSKVETQMDKKTPADLAKAKAKAKTHAELAHKDDMKNQAQADQWATSAKYRLKDMVVENAKQSKIEEKEKKARRKAQSQLLAADQKVAKDKQLQADAYILKMQNTYKADLAHERSEKQAKETAVAEHNLQVEDAERKVKHMSLAVKRDRKEHAANVMIETAIDRKERRKERRIAMEKAAEAKKMKLLEADKETMKRRKSRAASIVEEMEASIPPVQHPQLHTMDTGIGAADVKMVPLDKQLDYLGEGGEKDAKYGISPSEVADRKKMIEAAERQVQAANRVVHQDEQAHSEHKAGNKIANELKRAALHEAHQAQFRESHAQNLFPETRQNKVQKADAQMLTIGEIASTMDTAGSDSGVRKAYISSGGSGVSESDIEEWKASKKLSEEQSEIAQTKAEVKKANLAVKQDEAAMTAPATQKKAVKKAVKKKHSISSAHMNEYGELMTLAAQKKAVRKKAVNNENELSSSQQQEYDFFNSEQKPESTSAQLKEFKASKQAQQQQEFKRDVKADQHACERDCKNLQDWQQKANGPEPQLVQEPAVGAECDCEAAVDQLVEVIPDQDLELAENPF